MTSKPKVRAVIDYSAVSTPEAFLASNELRDQQLAANQARTEAYHGDIESTRVKGVDLKVQDTLRAHRAERSRVGKDHGWKIHQIESFH